MVRKKPHVVGEAWGKVTETGKTITEWGKVGQAWGIPGADLAVAAGEKIAPEQIRKDRAEFRAYAGSYVADMRLAVSADKGSVMSDRDMLRLQSILQVEGASSGGPETVAAIDAVDELFAKYGIEDIDDYERRIEAAGGKTTPPGGGGTVAPPSSERKPLTQGADGVWR